MIITDVIKELNKLEQFDQELAHIEADKLLLKALESLLPGKAYAKLEKAYENIEKWYA